MFPLFNWRVGAVAAALFAYVARDENDQPRPVDQPSVARA